MPPCEAGVCAHPDQRGVGRHAQVTCLGLARRRAAARLLQRPGRRRGPRWRGRRLRAKAAGSKRGRARPPPAAGRRRPPPGRCGGQRNDLGRGPSRPARPASSARCARCASRLSSGAAAPQRAAGRGPALVDRQGLLGGGHAAVRLLRCSASRFTGVEGAARGRGDPGARCGAEQLSRTSAWPLGETPACHWPALGHAGVPGAAQRDGTGASCPARPASGCAGSGSPAPAPRGAGRQAMPAHGRRAPAGTAEMQAVLDHQRGAPKMKSTSPATTLCCTRRARRRPAGASANRCPGGRAAAPVVQLDAVAARRSATACAPPLSPAPGG
jgi:hypothetical protein